MRQRAEAEKSRQAQKQVKCSSLEGPMRGVFLLTDVSHRRMLRLGMSEFCCAY